MDKSYIFISKPVLYIIILITSVVPLVIWPHGSDYFYYPKICVIYFLLIVALIVIFTSYKKSSSYFEYTSEMIPISIFIFFVILSTIFSPYFYQALWGKELRNEGAVTYVSYFLIFYFSCNIIKKEDDIKKIILPLLISSSIISVIGIMQYLGIDIIPKDVIRASWKYSSFSTLGNPDFVGSYLSIIFPMSLILYLNSNKKSHVLAMLLSSISSYGSLICTQARSAWVGVILSLFFLALVFIKSLPRVIKKLSFFLAGAVIITFILNIAHNGAISSRFNSIVNDYKNITSSSNQVQEKSTAGSQRVFIWTRTLDYLFERPILGSGPDTFDKVFKMSPEEAEYHFESKAVYVDKAHNEYLQIAVTLGFPALISYLLFLAIVLYKSIKSISKGYYNKYTLCLLSGVFAYMVQAFFNISVVSAAPVYWSLIGLLVGVNKVNKNKLHV